MQTNQKRKQPRWLGAVAGALLATASASSKAVVTYTYTGANSGTFSEAGHSLDTSGWALRSDDSVINLTADIHKWNGGIGIEYWDDQRPYKNYDYEHTIDNFDDWEKVSRHSQGWTSSHEFVILDFGAEMVSLTGFSTGWTEYSGDFDSTILAFDGSSGDYSDPTSKSSISSSWDTIGHFSSIGTKNTSSPVSVNVAPANSANATFSSHWIIGAYMPQFGSNVFVDDGDDGFKLNSISFISKPEDTVPGGEAPSPATMLLLLLGLPLLRLRAR
ncbi:hypothetical protein HBA55_26290 [Pseudomaricurvus alkylphenolicus]|uniref:exosortase-dependent surface protein XDP1 n=1 Tax=Pseudomaricurvus alkylphenolicus TaxID=1306991 RepID=UPI001420E22B|nr:exosortase-dependent surface protein XDP1 [Pseudomaricurvus alkylphenolicus]NIB43145.1 hypothetical protein [Pseudomaricurvus alkylphenolicus]